MFNLLRLGDTLVRRGRKHRLKYAHKSSATAQIARQPFANFRQAGVGIALDQLHRSHQHTGRTNAALRATALQKCLLYPMQRAIVREPFNRLDLRSFSLNRRHQTAIHQFAIHA
jgi:hypothetical protein